jgi:hypothetical protein
MTSSDFNAPLGSADGRRPRPSLARLLAPLQAALHRAGANFVLELEPMPAIDALSTWSNLSEGDSSSTLLLRMPVAARRATGAAAPADSTPLASIAQRVGVKITEVLAPDVLVVSDEAARELVTLGAVTDLVAVRIDGPVESRDAAAISDALAAGQSPLSVELRAAAVLEIRGGETVVITSRQEDDVLRFVAESLRHYLASVRKASAMAFAAPDLGLVRTVIGRSGRITVRPLETEVYSTSVDVGVSTDEQGEVRPADCSLIYDIHSNSWHGD